MSERLEGYEQARLESKIRIDALEAENAELRRDATVIADDDVYMTFSDGTIHFEEVSALARLLAEEVIFINSHWWEKEWPEEAQKTIAMCVNCNDVFAWASADTEGFLHDEIQDLYDHWIKDRSWGAAVWCIKKRKQLPQKPVLDAINKDGIWNLDDAIAASKQEKE